MDKLIRKLVTFPNVTLGTIAEAWVFTKILPGWLPKFISRLPEENRFLSLLFALLGLNYFLFVLYLGLILNYFISGIRHFPQPNTKSARKYYWTAIGVGPGEKFLEYAENTDSDEGIALLRSPFVSNRLLVTGPKALQEILVNNTYQYEKTPELRGFLRHVLGDGLILVEGEQHKFQRKHLKPAFSFRHIKDLYSMMWVKATAVTEHISQELKHNKNAPIEINSWANKVTMDIIGIAGLGREFNYMKNRDDEMVRDYEELLEPTGEKMLFFISWTFGPQALVSKLPWRLNKIFKSTTSSLHRITRELVRDKREAIKIGADEHFDILSLLIKSEDFSDAELGDQLLTFLAAGHETTSSAFTWVVYLLAKHPEVQRKVREEVRAALPDDPRQMSADDLATTLEKLPLINAVASETLRLYPTVPITIRMANTDTTLLGHPIAKGTQIFLAPWATNRLRSVWGEDADEFKPERWINDDDTPNYSGGVESNYSFMTFLHGPRSCIGQGFARAELRVLVAAFVGRFEWELAMKEEDVQPGGVITIKPTKGMYVKLKEVGNWPGAEDGIVLDE